MSHSRLCCQIWLFCALGFMMKVEIVWDNGFSLWRVYSVVSLCSFLTSSAYAFDYFAGYRHISLRTEANFPMSLPTLFCDIDISIYIPDGLGDFMSALSDPGAFEKLASEQRKKLAAMGIEPAGSDNVATVKPLDSSVKFEQITVDSLILEKGFQKTAKKNKKELDSLAKKQIKERVSVQKEQHSVITKLMKGKKYDSFCTIQSLYYIYI
jgi:hypothetical protein